MAHAGLDRLAGKLAGARRKPPPDTPPPPSFPHALGPDPNKGQYRIPGLGAWGKEKNVREAKRRNRPWTGQDESDYQNAPQGPSWPGHTNKNSRS